MASSGDHINRQIIDLYNDVTSPRGSKQGWQCPVCERVYSPYQSECEHCNQTADLPSSLPPYSETSVTLKATYVVRLKPLVYLEDFDEGSDA